MRNKEIYHVELFNMKKLQKIKIKKVEKYKFNLEDELLNNTIYNYQKEEKYSYEY